MAESEEQNREAKLIDQFYMQISYLTEMASNSGENLKLSINVVPSTDKYLKKSSFLIPYVEKRISNEKKHTKKLYLILLKKQGTESIFQVRIVVQSILLK